MKRKMYSAATKAKAVAAFRDGVSAEAVSKKFNVPVNALYVWRLKAGKAKKIAEAEAKVESPMTRSTLRKIPQIADAIDFLRIHRDEVVASGRNPTKRELAAMYALAELETL